MARKHLLWLVPALLLAGCLKPADTKKADEVTARFYREVAAKQYQSIYDEGAPDLKNAIAGDAFVALMQRIDTNMGACQPPRKRFDIHTNINPQGTFRGQGYTRACAKGPLNETVTIVIRNGDAKLAGYRVDTLGGAGASSESSD